MIPLTSVHSRLHVIGVNMCHYAITICTVLRYHLTFIENYDIVMPRLNTTPSDGGLSAVQPAHYHTPIHLHMNTQALTCALSDTYTHKHTQDSPVEQYKGG